MNFSIPRHENHYRTDPRGQYMILEIHKGHRMLHRSPRFSDVNEARRYCKDWNDFNPAPIKFIVVEAECK